MSNNPKVLLYCPTYKVNGKAQIHELTRKSIHDQQFNGKLVIEINTVNRHVPPNYQNVMEHYIRARERVLSEGFDALFTVEHDMVLPEDALQKLWDLNAPVAYGIYLFRGSKQIVNVFRMVNADNLDMSLSFYQDELKEAIHQHTPEVSGCGNGCTLIRREVLEKIPFRQADNGSYCVDMPFATDCLRAGIKQFAHFGVRCGHIIDNKILYLKEGAEIPMTQVAILQTFNASDGKHYEQGDTVALPDELVDQYSRAGYIQILSNHKLSVPIFNEDTPSIEYAKPVIAFRRHQKKGEVLIQALQDRGYEVVSHTDIGARPDALIIDHDIPDYGIDKILKKYTEYGIPIIIYPHGAAPLLVWDGISEPYPHIKANLVTSLGNKRVMERYGYPHPIHVIGWYLTEIRPFKATKGKKVLYAPNHPILGHKFMFPEERETNAKTYLRLLSLLETKRISKLTVRHIGELEDNGLWEDPRVDIIRSAPDNNAEEIETADVVIASGTYAWMAVALGKPTVMLTQLVNARQPDLETRKPLVAKSIEKYEEYLRYPYDVERDQDLGKVIKMATAKEALQWRKRFIGDPFDPSAFCDLLEEIIYHGDN